MEMDLGTTIVWVILLLVGVIPFIIMYRNRLGKERAMLLSLQSAAGENGSNIHQHELCSDFAIGIDEQKNSVLFFNRQKNGGVSNYIDLSTIKTCQSVKSTRTVVNNSEHVVITERVTLNFSPKQPGKNDLVIELYNEASHAQLNGELQFADKWSKLISSRL